MVKTLSRAAFDRAKRFIDKKARPVEGALFAYYFENGSGMRVLAALVPYQNPDGGFGHGIEPDLRSGASSVIGTVTALDIMRRVQADEATPGLPAALAYLVDAWDAETGRWPIVPPDIENAPHAPWWSYADSAENFGGFWANPRAAVVAHLQQYPRLSPSSFTGDALRAVIDDLMRAPQRMTMHDLLSFLDLLETDGLPREHYESILDKLRRALPHSVVTEPAKWGGYGLQPLEVVRTPASPLAGVLDQTAIDANLDYLVDQQQPDGSWAPNWTWDFIDPDAWDTADREWRGVLILRNLCALQAYGRIEGL